MNFPMLPRPLCVVLPGILLIAAVLTACGDNTEPSERVTGSESAAETSQVSLDEYLEICSLLYLVDLAEDTDLNSVPVVWGEHTRKMESVNPPEEVADWHNAQLAYLRALNNAFADSPEPGEGESEDELSEFILFELIPLGLEYQPEISEAVNGMNPAVRDRMVQAGCIENQDLGERGVDTNDEAGTGGVEDTGDATEIPVGGIVHGSVDEPGEVDAYFFRAEAEETYLIVATGEAFQYMSLEITDLGTFSEVRGARPPLRHSWTAPESGKYFLQVSSGGGSPEGTGSYAVSVWDNEAIAEDNFCGEDKLLSLSAAIKSNDDEGVQCLIEKWHADVNATDDRGRSMLDIAIQEAKPEIVRLLMEAGADVNATDDRGDSMLELAILRNKLEMVRLLVEAGADVSVTGKRAASIGRVDLEIFRLLVEAGADVNVTDDRGNSMLLLAIDGDYNPDPEMVRLLVEAGADVNATDDRGRSMLELAIDDYNPEIVRILVEAGAEDVNATDDFRGGRSVLELAIEDDNPEIVRLLVEAGADVNTINTTDADDGIRYSMLQKAIEDEETEIVRLLVEAGADVNHN